ncbi:MAG TPA: amidohydrolase family protein [Acidimicrobiales bacterium]|jgi:predicted TIM-barrel fold metal-dependent hydrolase|nr:amidohydrolase family protein [Acidimicrobiales bacterium]
MVVDVDTHWESTRFAPGNHPLEGYLDRLPRTLDRLAFALAGDLLAALPVAHRPAATDLLPHIVERAARDGGPPAIHPLHDATASDRVAWMDRIGVDQALVNPGGYWQMLDLLGADRSRALVRCNDYLADELADHRDRLFPVTIVDFSDLAAAVAEMARMRSKGSRAFFLYSVNGQPVGGLSPGHPAWDIVWSAATDLGMVAVVHVGNTSADFSGWANIGWDEPGGAGAAGLLRLANTQRSHVAEMFLNALVFGGVFARHPTLTVLLAELRVGWLPYFVARCDQTTQPSPALGPWPFDLSGGEFLRRNVRVTPLPGFGDRDALSVMAELPEMFVFSSDFPHAEGNADPIELYRPGLDALEDSARSWFLGANMHDCYARMGDPLG